MAALGNLALAANARRFQRQTLRAPGEKQLKIDKLARSRRRHLRANPEQTGADPALQRAQCLPFQFVGGKRIAVALAYRLRVNPLSPVLVVALRAGPIHLPMPLVVK